MITPKKNGRLKPFIEYMHEDDSPGVVKLFSLKKLPSIYGPDKFITKIKESFYFKKKNYEVPESKSLAPTENMIIDAVCRYYNVSLSDLLITKRGSFNKPRNIAIYLLRHIRGEELINIGKRFNIRAYSTVSSILNRVARLKIHDRKINKQLDEIKEAIYKGQT